MPVVESFGQWDIAAHLRKLALVWEYTHLGPFFMNQQSAPADDGTEKPAGPWSEPPHSSNPPSYPIDCRDSKSGSGAPSLAFGHLLDHPKHPKVGLRTQDTGFAPGLQASSHNSMASTVSWSQEGYRLLLTRRGGSSKLLHLHWEARWADSGSLTIPK